MPTAASSIPRKVDVVIVGCGPAGAATAALLGRFGVRTLVMDQAAEILETPRAIALDNEALRILQSVGITHEELDAVLIDRVSMRSPDVGEFVRVDVSGRSDGHPRLVTFYQPDLERALRRRLHALPSVTLVTETTFQRFDTTRTGVRVCLSRHDETHQVDARYLVAADGANSSIRGLIGQAFAGTTYPQDWLIVDALAVPHPIDHVEFICDCKRPVAHMVAPNGRERWEFMLQAGERREQMETEDTIRTLLAPWCGDTPVAIERKAVYRFHARSCERYREGPVFLVGDAAHITPPFAGQGLVAGLRDAANLSWKLAWVLDGRAGEHILDSYDTERRPHAKSMIDLARYMGGLIMPTRRLSAWLAHGVLKLLRQIPGLRRSLESTQIKPKNAFREGLFAPRRAWRSVRAPARGGVFPQVLIAAAQQAPKPSDDVLGAGLAIVGVDCDPLAHATAETCRNWTACGGAALCFVSGHAPTAHGASTWTIAGERSKRLRGLRGRVFVVRPDLTILHDGPAAKAETVLRESLALIAGQRTRPPSLATPSPSPIQP